MKVSKAFSRKSNRAKSKKSPDKNYKKNIPLPKTRPFMLVLYYIMSAMIVLAIYLKLRHYILVHW